MTRRRRRELILPDQQSRDRVIIAFRTDGERHLATIQYTSLFVRQNFLIRHETAAVLTHSQFGSGQVIEVYVKPGIIYSVFVPRYSCHE